ncbi:hypothetical protein [Candidatus Laterigemmans baculatus]|uniref:hypothetical protein n=1 Tax=Candidatus Laterigemmans baculatus TaxID=2770505 RepID=UPI0013DC8BA3|nr:hypothetical protein [Candidatus Laterigemmans baculatus]
MSPKISPFILILLFCGTAHGGLMVGYPGEMFSRLGDASDGAEQAGGMSLLSGWQAKEESDSRRDRDGFQERSGGMQSPTDQGSLTGGSASAIMPRSTSVIDPQATDSLLPEDGVLPPLPDLDGLIKPPRNA